MYNTKVHGDFSEILLEGSGNGTEQIQIVSFDQTSPYAVLLDARLKAEAERFQPLIHFESWRENRSPMDVAIAVLVNGKPKHVFLVRNNFPVELVTYEAVVLGLNPEEKQQGSLALRMALKAATTWARQQREGWLFIVHSGSNDLAQQIRTAFEPNHCYLEAEFDSTSGKAAVLSFFCQDTA